MPRMGGIELLDAIGTAAPNALTVIMTGFGTVETAIDAMKRGAYDYILKPFKVEEVIRVVQRGLEKQRLAAENLRLREAVSLYKVSEAIAASLSLEEVLATIGDTALHELKGDLVSTWLDDGEGGYFERQRLVQPRSGATRRSRRPRASPELPRPASGTPPAGRRGGRAAHRLGVRRARRAAVHRSLRGALDAARAGGEGRRASSRRRPRLPLVSLVSVPLRMKTRLLGWICVASFTKQKRFNEGHRKLLSIVGSRAAAAIENARLYEDLRATFQQTIQGLARAIDKMDRYTAGHSERVATYATYLAVRLGPRRPTSVEIVRQSALMHDIGKIGCVMNLNKPGKLTQDEYEIFKRHPAYGKDILDPIKFLHPLVPGRAPAPRALGRSRLPARPQGQRRPAHRAHHRRRRHLRRDDERPRLPPRAPARGRGRRDRALQRHAVRSRGRALVHGRPRRLPRRARRSKGHDPGLKRRGLTYRARRRRAIQRHARRQASRVPDVRRRPARARLQRGPAEGRRREDAALPRAST